MINLIADMGHLYELLYKYILIYVVYSIHMKLDFGMEEETF